MGGECAAMRVLAREGEARVGRVARTVILTATARRSSSITLVYFRMGIDVEYIYSMVVRKF